MSWKGGLAPALLSTYEATATLPSPSSHRHLEHTLVLYVQARDATKRTRTKRRKEKKDPQKFWEKQQHASMHSTYYYGMPSSPRRLALVGQDGGERVTCRGREAIEKLTLDELEPAASLVML